METDQPSAKVHFAEHLIEGLVDPTSSMMIKKNPVDTPKYYLGGYRHKKTGKMYMHATTQTLTPMERRAMVFYLD